jgi:hypothetical protein
MCVCVCLIIHRKITGVIDGAGSRSRFNSNSDELLLFLFLRFFSTPQQNISALSKYIGPIYPDKKVVKKRWKILRENQTNPSRIICARLLLEGSLQQQQQLSRPFYSTIAYGHKWYAT